MKRHSRVGLLAIGMIAGAAFFLVRAVSRDGALGKSSADAAPTVRPAAVAGTFYPLSAETLRADVRRYLDEASAGPSTGELTALIVPHAGYGYSGPVAGYAYGALEGKRYDTVVVVGSNHRVPFEGVALSGAQRWTTPLGEMEVDRAACDAIAAECGAARVSDGPHGPEHSIEVQLPFLQATLGSPTLVPVLMADSSPETCDSLARALADWARGRSVLLVASSDMSHYPAYEDAVRVDGETLKAIETLDPAAVAATTKRLMSEGVPGLDTCLCGEGPVRTVLAAARLLGADQAKVLRYATSGDAPRGSRGEVVGYGAVAIYRPADKRAGAARTMENELDAGQQRRLLSIARDAVEQYVRTGRTLELKETDPMLMRPGAAFVTLTKDGALRGCIGSLKAEAPLAETVRNRAIDAATHDPRFRAVKPKELAGLEIEISVLSPVRGVESPEEIDISRHGVIVSSGSRQGVFLPQVAAETGWSRDVLLSHLCQDKAGLAADAWKTGAALSVFTVQAFGEAAGEDGRAGE